MERFVQAIVVGGLALVAGLWVGTLVEPGTLAWAGGGLLALAGVAGLAYGIATELDL